VVVALMMLLLLLLLLQAMQVAQVAQAHRHYCASREQGVHLPILAKNSCHTSTINKNNSNINNMNRSKRRSCH